ncbi:DUF397 domain-containing protein [Nocardiopsis dassonvillei]|uniref:DUF397 domain-containing protein n=1 Tax=Nocardiopsis dassonvillei TaxID=2014 RepID=UPI00201024B2|nr:DUF397 domain-containing protein [Nocardiopsis dassonvillei]MCK9871691.1 DUF397 domain-containing protein [Nocardiopsis dassonvillei]
MTSVPTLLNFRKSSYSQPTGGNCVEVAETEGGAAMRDTKNRAQGHLMFTPTEWAAFMSTMPR